MRNLLLVIIAVLFFIPADARHKKRKAQKVTKGPIVSVMIHHTACFGRCPDYKVEISNDGTATYTGIRFVTDSGVFKKNIGIKRANDIFNIVMANRLDTCKKMYENRVPDLPGLYYTIKYKDSTKNILNAEWGPYILREIADSIEAVGKKTDNSWKRSK